jgi:hypothetical protein
MVTEAAAVVVSEVEVEVVVVGESEAGEEETHYQYRPTDVWGTLPSFTHTESEKRPQRRRHTTNTTQPTCGVRYYPPSHTQRARNALSLKPTHPHGSSTD